MARVLDMPRGVQLGVSPSSGTTTFTDGDGCYVTTFTTNTSLGAIAGGANLGLGKALFTFPSGVIRVLGAYMSMAVKQTEAHITADTPDIGLGTTVASGVVAVLGGTAAFENILTGQTAADCNGTATVAHVATDLLIASGDSHVVYLNVADGWAASGDAGALLYGSGAILWAKMG